MNVNYSNNNTEESACKVTDTICLPDSDLPRVVIIGGGFAGLALTEKLKHKEIQVILIDKNNFHQFQPLLYQVATSALEPDSIVFPSENNLMDIKTWYSFWQKLKKFKPHQI
mgnify:CR=1 FL=1